MTKTALILGGTKGLGLALAWEAYYLKIDSIIAGSSAWNDKVRQSCPPDSKYLPVDLRVTADVTLKPQALETGIDYFFWVSGILKEKPFVNFSRAEMLEMTDVHYTGPIEFLRNLTRNQVRYQKPFHLVTISSTSSWRVRDNQAIYCSLQAAKSAFITNFSRELARDLPGSKVTLIHPGGMKTDLFRGTKTDISNFMDTNIVSRIIWNEVVSQKAPFHEVQIMRNDDGTPNISYGPRMPELPFGSKE